MSAKTRQSGQASRKFLLLSVCLLLLVGVSLAVIEDTAEVLPAPSRQVLTEVSVVSIQAGTHSGVVSAYAEIQPRWRTSINAQAQGEITELNPKAFAGQQVKKGQSLLRIQSSLYRAQFHEAQQSLLAEKLQLAQEKQRSAQALLHWRRAGIDAEPSALVLNTPQLALAEQTLKAATSRVSAARTQLAYTHVKAPFSGYITQREVSLGQSVSEGQPLLQLIGSEYQDMTVQLSESQWLRLARPVSNLSATLHDDHGQLIGRATVTHGGGYVDKKSRQYSLFMTVNGNGVKLALGRFVEVRLPSIAVANSLKIPAASVTPAGNVWHVNRAGRLQRFIAEVLFYEGSEVVICEPQRSTAEWQIVTLPLAAFLPGIVVRPVQRVVLSQGDVQ